jgi:1-acyl-sn-glycerol-3-phosphate acyltransferase
MIKKLFIFIFKLRGWKIEGRIPEGVKKCVIIGAPHTSNWDFIYGIAALALFKIDVKYLAKKEIFRFPFKKTFIKYGGIPVDRSKSNSMVDAMIEVVKKKDEIMIVFPAEATRKRVDKWKTGFYHVAQGAEVPIVLGYMDYKRKVAGFGPALFPSDKNADLNYIREFYRNIIPCIPENFNPDFEF